MEAHAINPDATCPIIRLSCSTHDIMHILRVVEDSRMPNQSLLDQLRQKSYETDFDGKIRPPIEVIDFEDVEAIIRRTTADHAHPLLHDNISRCSCFDCKQIREGS